MSPFPVDRPLDVTREVRAFAANPTVRMPIEIAILFLFKAEVKDFDGPFERIAHCTARQGRFGDGRGSSRRSGGSVAAVAGSDGAGSD